MNEIDLLNNSNKNLDTLALQIQKAKMSDEPVMVKYFEELRDIVLKRYKTQMLELCNEPKEFIKEGNSYYYR